MCPSTAELGVSTLPVFPTDALPGWIADQVAAVAEATQTPHDLAGCVGLAALSTVAGGRAFARVRRGWVEPVNLYTVVVMKPSERKSPVFNAMIRPIYALEQRLREQATENIQTALVQRRAAEAALDKAEKVAASAPAEQRDSAITEAIQAALSAAAIDVPAEPKLVVDDITPERVASVLAEQSGRLAILSDEGTIFSIIAGRYSGNVNTNVFLKGYSGTQLRVDRAARPAELVENPALTLGLTVQPAVIEELGHTAMLRGSGFLARILFSLPTSMVGHRNNRPNPVPEAVEQNYDDHLAHLARTLAWLVEPAVFQFSAQADDAMADLQDEIEIRLEPHRGDWAHIGDWGGKLAGQTARIAALLHAATHPDNPEKQQVSGDTFDKARRLADYYGAHALAVFDHITTDPTVDNARRVLAWIEHDRPATFTRRELFSALDRGRFRRADDLDAPLTLLTEHGHIQQQPPPERRPGQRGRPPSPTYWTHPTYRQPPR
ncbi:YfjI family protein [Pseudonocardia sp. Cha107L01]|uniref:YfjI family protein n=1 Tax=Pseudonocardia sp. Cha107L01 TaxID=3457576 RepID=UPI00403EB3DD